MSYTPPSQTAVDFEMTTGGAYTPPGQTSVDFEMTGNSGAALSGEIDSSSDLDGWLGEVAVSGEIDSSSNLDGWLGEVAVSGEIDSSSSFDGDLSADYRLTGEIDSSSELRCSPSINLSPDLTSTAYAIGDEYESSYGVAKAFDDDTGTYWGAGDTWYTTTGWIGQDFGEGNEQKITLYKIMVPSAGSACPDDWTFEGSSDGTNWTVLDTRTDQGDLFEDDVFREYELSNDSFYRYYRINVSANNGQQYYLFISEIEMMAPPHVETAGAADIVLYPFYPMNEWAGTVRVVVVVKAFEALALSGGDRGASLPYPPPKVVVETLPAPLHWISGAWPPSASVEIDGFDSPGTDQTWRMYDPADVEIRCPGIRSKLEVTGEAESGLRRIFKCRLTGSADGVSDVWLPISSIQARIREEGETYLSVVVPDGWTYADEISERSNGDIIIYGGWKDTATGAETLQELTRVDLESVDLDQGPNSYSVTITGHKAGSAESPQPATLEDPLYRSLRNGTRRYRYARIDFNVRPGDTVTTNDETFTIDYVTYIVGSHAENMEIKEAV